MKAYRKIGILLLIIFVVMQFAQPKKNKAEGLGENDISKVYVIPDGLHKTLVKKCYDCHSNNTQYPWYQRIQPVSWYLEGHIEDGKEELNFSDFGSYSDRMQKAKMRSIISQVEDGKMPLPSYTLLHPEAELTAAEKQLLVKWIEEMQ